MLGYSFAELLIVDLLFSTPQPEGHQLLSLALKITVIADAKGEVKRPNSMLSHQGVLFSAPPPRWS